MRKIFLDCGTHFGQGIIEISQYEHIDNTWEVFTWEANPYTFNRFPADEFLHLPNLNRFQQAVTNNDGEINLNINSDEANNHKDTGMGSSIIDLSEWLSVEGKHSGYFSESIQVKSIDFSKWIKTNCLESDFIVLKLDIEGVEYQVLEKMLEDDTLKYIDSLYVEWHYWVFDNQEPYINRQQTIMQKIKELNIRYADWH